MVSKMSGIIQFAAAPDVCLPDASVSRAMLRPKIARPKKTQIPPFKMPRVHNNTPSGVYMYTRWPKNNFFIEFLPYLVVTNPPWGDRLLNERGTYLGGRCFDSDQAPNPIKPKRPESDQAAVSNSDNIIKLHGRVNP